MKATFLLIVTLALLPVFSHAQFKAGIIGGISSTHQRINLHEGSFYAGEKQRGFSAGLTGDLKLAGNFYLQPQLLYSRKVSSLNSSNNNGDAMLKLSYIELPLSVLYKVDLPFGKAFGGAGAAFGYAIKGRMEQNGNKNNIYSNSNDWNRKDLSMRFTTGIEFNNGFFASLTSQKGLVNISKVDGTSIKNRSTMVSVGYLLDWKKCN